MESHSLPGRLLFLASAALLFTLGAYAEPDSAAHELLRRIEGARPGLPSLRWDGALAAAASLYATELRARGEISHAGPGGELSADRACRAGCTDAVIGEIIGAGPGAALVVAAWLASPSHCEVLRGSRWTHVGAGVAGAGAAVVYVVLFSVRQAEELRIEEQQGRLLLRGRLLAPDASFVFLIVDLESREPLEWVRASGEFTFAFDPSWIGSSYVRLGYISRSGGLEVTNVLRSGTRLPGLGADRRP